MKKYYLILFGYKNPEKNKLPSDHPLLEVRSLDSKFEIKENISLHLVNEDIDVLEVSPNSPTQEEYINKYIELRRNKLVGLALDENDVGKYIFDFTHSRTVGHILFMALSLTKQAHPELYKISSGHFQFTSKSIQESLDN